MAISINWATKVISIPQSYLTSLGGAIYELDCDQFRLDLRALEDDEEGIVFLPTHTHNAEVTVAGTVLSRSIIIINGYTITFEDGQYAVNMVGANTNFAEVTNVNQVSIRAFNTAGLITLNLSYLTAYFTNKLIIDKSTNDWILYDTDGISELARWTLKDIDGNTISVPEGAIAQRIPQ